MDVEKLSKEAWAEPIRNIDLDAYAYVVVVLRRHKGFTFRQIAQWFESRGVAMDHNQAYRTYQKKVKV